MVNCTLNPWTSLSIWINPLAANHCCRDMKLIGWLGKLNTKEEAQLRGMVQDGGDGEKLVEFYEGYDNGTIPDEVYSSHLNSLAEGFAELELKLSDRSGGGCCDVSREVLCDSRAGF
jgi:hypothetical protein